MLKAYIAGPYRADTWEGIEKNIQAAAVVAVKYWRMGYAVICPHKNTSHFDGLAPDEIWLRGDIELLKCCDVIVMMTNWKESKGAIEEHTIAKHNGLKVIYEDE